MPNQRLNHLFELLNSNKINAEEHKELLLLMANSDNEEQVKELAQAKWETFEPNEPPFTTDQSRELYERISLKLEINIPHKKFRLWPRIAAAASIILMLGIGGYLYYCNAPSTNIAMGLPKQQGVVLTLANGKKVQIDPMHQGDTYSTDDTQIDQRKGEIVYQPQANTNAKEMIHTLANNSGNKYQLTLSDGTEAYLDAQSTISYPAQFTGKQRKVTITGQAYFKVKHDADKPFIVTAKDQTIKDIGTEFNIRAYENVAVTTLLEGSVRIQSAGLKNSILLKPGEQGSLIGPDLVVKTADLEEAVAWLQGKLVFNHETLESILAQVSRIYDVKFTWQNEDLKTIKFNGAVSRTRKLGTIINFFRNTERVDFKIEDDSIKVIKHQ